MKSDQLNASERLVFDSSRQLLKELGMAEEEVVLNLQDVSWDAVFDFLRRNKLFPTLYPVIARHAPTSHRQKFADLFEAHKRYVDRMIEELAAIWPVIEGEDPRACISKSFVSSEIIFGNIYQRAFADLDVFTTVDIEKLGRSLFARGYESERNKGSVEIPYHQTFWEVEYRKELDAQTAIRLELKWKHTSFDQAHAEFFQESVQIAEFGGRRIRISNLLASCLLTIGAAYKNSDCLAKYAMRDSVKLREYVDLGAFLLRCGQQFDAQEFVQVLETLNYGYRSMVVMKDLCSLYPAFLRDPLVSAVLSRKWEAPAYSLYYPDLRWRSPILDRVVRKEQGAAEFLALLKAKWFDSGRDCVALSRETLPFSRRLDLVNLPGTVRFGLAFSAGNRLAVEVEVPDWLVRRYPCSFMLHVTFEDAPLLLPPPENVRIEFGQETPVSATEVSRTYRTEIASDALLKGRTGSVRLCLCPVVFRQLENGGKKDLTEDHFWALPTLMNMQVA